MLKRRAGMRRLVLSMFVIVAVASACDSGSHAPRASDAAAPRPVAATAGTTSSNAFLTVAEDRSRLGWAVQLRRLSDGHLLHTAVQAVTGTEVSATRDPQGRVLAGLTKGCNTVLKRVDPTTGRTTTLRTVAEPVFDLTASPDGVHVAYLTQTNCVPGTCPSRPCHNSIQQGPPTVLVALDLRTGGSVRSATSSSRHAVQGLSWSPEGHSLVVGYEGTARKLDGYAGPEYQLLILDAADPDFRTAQRIPNQPGCSAFAPTWTSTGIVAVEGCHPDQLLSPSRLVRISPSGAVTAYWPLPGCIDGASTVTGPTHHQVLVQTDIGYGNGKCGKDWATRISRVSGSSLHTVMNLPGASIAIDLDR